MGALATFTFALSLLTAQVAASPVCETLEFVPVAPDGKSKTAPCDKNVDRSLCEIDQGYSRFGKLTASDGKTYLRLRFAAPSAREITDYLEPLKRSEAVRTVNRLRIEARRLAGRRDPCEPNYIYLGSKKVFGVGPAYVSSTRFVLPDGRTTDNLIVAEDAKAPFHIPLAMLSKKSLIEAGYYELVIAHELAHGLMQDLYGVDDFARLEKRVVSRDGHFASGTTDPTLAWIEGFAEAFEAWLGEKTLSAAAQATPFIDKLMAKVHSRIGDFDRWGWKGYIFTIPGTIAQTASTMLNIDDFVSDFLKHERQQPIRDNHYVLRGAFNNLSHHYGLPLASGEREAEQIFQWEAESGDSIYSKEGVVAHFIYRALSAGLAAEVFETISWARPRDFWEFASAFRAALDESRLPLVADAYKTIFTEKGRAAVRRRLQLTIDPDNRNAVGFDRARIEAEYMAALEKIEVPAKLTPPLDLWIEFWNPSLTRWKLHGYMDRINVSTAPPSRVDAFLKTLDLPKERRGLVLDALLAAREELVDSGRVTRLEDFAARWVELVKSDRFAGRSRPRLAADVANAAAQINRMRACYLSRCLAGRARK